MIKKSELILRLGIAFAFFYSAIAGFLDPAAWIGWLPDFLRFPEILIAFEVSELLVGFWLLSGYKTFWAASASAAMLAGIVVFNLPAMAIVFRDLSLTAAAVSLAVLTFKNEQSR